MSNNCNEVKSLSDRLTHSEFGMMTTTKILNQRYRLDKQLGKGGMANVFQARDLMLERNVAVKILREDFCKDELFRTRFHQEAKAAANLTHPNIVTVHDFGLDAERLFIVMEHVPGNDLKMILTNRGRFSVNEALPLIIQACAGIGYAHRAGLVHCDIKPHNMLITPDKRLKVTDFGIARAMASINPAEVSNIVWGSPQYFSPEQASGSAPSPASDVYSLGVVIYQMLTGGLPFKASTHDEFIQQHLANDPIPPRALNPDIPQLLEEIVLKVLSKEPSARYRTADQLGRVLINFAQPHGGETNLPMDSSMQYALSGYPESRTMRAQGLSDFMQSAIAGFSDIDWLSIGLGLLALIAVGGLIPFWMWIYFMYNPVSP